MKRFSLFIGMLSMVTIILATSPGDSVAQGQSKGGPDKQYLAFGTSTIGGNYYVCGGGIASVVNKAYPWIQINAEVTGGTHANLLLLGNKKIHMALASNDEAFYAFNGLGRFKSK